MMNKEQIALNLKQALDYTEAYVTPQALEVIVDLMDRTGVQYTYRDYHDIANDLARYDVVQVLDDYALLPELKVSELEDWFSDHEQAYEDLLIQAGVENIKELELEDYMDWLGYHDQAYLDYLSWLLEK